MNTQQTFSHKPKLGLTQKVKQEISPLNCQQISGGCVKTPNSPTDNQPTAYLATKPTGITIQDRPANPPLNISDAEHEHGGKLNLFI